jgi:type VI secretion system protein ImpF
MAELNTKERLQPDLLERLTDESRYVTSYTISVTRAELQRLQLTAADLISILSAQGLREVDRATAVNDADSLRLEFTAGSLAASLAQIKQLQLKPPGMPTGISLQQFVVIESTTHLNQQVESGDRQLISTRRLRECVQRDLSSLLNTASLDAMQDLTPYPQVARSVLNYGMPSFAGLALHSVDPKDTARRIREVIEIYEPRLSRVQVIPETEQLASDGVTLGFRIEAELWSFPTHQHLVMKTSIDVESGDVRINEYVGS